MGVAFKTYRPFQLFYLLEFIKAWKALDATDREDLLSDPWAFKRFSFDLPARAAQSQRAALLNLVHPEAFEPITSEGTKKKIAGAFSEYVQTDSPDIDRQLAEIRAALNEEYGRIFMFWDDDVRPRWSPEPANGEPSTESRAWLFQANPDYFELDAALASLDSIEWTVKRYPSTEVHAGDRAYIWRSGSQTGGIVAVGSIVSEIYDAPPDPAEAPYWKSEQFKGVQPRVRIAIDRVLDQPLLRSILREDPVLKDLHVIRAPRGTVYPVPLNHEARLRELLGPHRRQFVTSFFSSAPIGATSGMKKSVSTTSHPTHRDPGSNFPRVLVLGSSTTVLDQEVARRRSRTSATAGLPKLRKSKRTAIGTFGRSSRTTNPSHDRFRPRSTTLAPTPRCPLSRSPANSSRSFCGVDH